MSKSVIVIAGPNGSGKTTFASEYLHDSDIEYISADALAAELVSTPEDLDKATIQAGRLFLQEIRRLIEAEKDFAVEVTLAGKGFERIIHRLKRAGYTVTIIFLFLKSPDVCIARVQNRVMAGDTMYQRKISCVDFIGASITFGTSTKIRSITGIYPTILENIFRKSLLVKEFSLR